MVPSNASHVKCIAVVSSRPLVLVLHPVVQQWFHLKSLFPCHLRYTMASNMLIRSLLRSIPSMTSSVRTAAIGSGKSSLSSLVASASRSHGEAFGSLLGLQRSLSAAAAAQGLRAAPSFASAPCMPNTTQGVSVTSMLVESSDVSTSGETHALHE